MKKGISILIMIFFFLVVSIEANCQQNLSEAETVDKEQEQLHLCFIYSNMLGFNINSIENPKLYQSISEWMGTPYKYSGKSKKGVDCSGLVCELYRDCNTLVLESCAKDLFHNSEQIKKTDLREGDLVFFKIKKNRISHVGIYLGQNKFVHASTKNGVIVSNLEDPYYKRYFYKGGRLKK